MLNFDFDGIAGFDWDAGNATKNETAHGVAQAEAEQVFFNAPLLVSDDYKHSQTEPRWHALGISNTGRRLQLTFTIRQIGTKTRIISARDMDRTERRYYEQTKAT